MIASTLPAPGLYEGVDFKTYHEWDAWGSTALKAMRRGPPARVLWERAHRTDTDATILGEQVHAALLTPDLWRAAHVVAPDGMEFRSKENKAWRDEHVAAGRVVLKSDRAAVVNAICAAIREKRTAAEAIDGCALRETSILWTCPTTGETCKGRPDAIDGAYLYDLKVCRYAEAPTLDYRAYVDGWMHQAAYYLTGLAEIGMTLRGARLIVVGPKAPHYVRCLEIKPGALDMCALDNEAALSALKSCRESGVWPGTPDEWVYVEPPAFALGEASVTFSGIEEE